MWKASEYVTYVPPERTLTVMDASNATPIVVTVDDAPFPEYALVTVADVEGNEAANGTYKARNITGSTFELFNADTGDPIAGTGEYTEGGTVVHASTGLLTCRWNRDKESSEGLKIDELGMWNRAEKILCFHKGFNTSRGVPVLEIGGHLLISGERWDFATDEQVIDAYGPIGAVQGMVRITVRKAVELNASKPGVMSFG